MALGALGLSSGVASAEAPPADQRSAAQRLLASYPDHLAAIDGNAIVWTDGTRMEIDDGRGEKPFAEWLANPDLDDMLAKPYPVGFPPVAPAPEADPGRARNQAFFDKMYGDCRRGEVEGRLVDIVWLPKKAGQRIKVTRVNGVSARLEAVSRALDDLPQGFDVHLAPAAGTYNCRPIAGTGRPSAHGYGIAIDIALKQADYWRWSKHDAAGRYPYRNRIPMEIVEIFEANGFIWGGRWYHYDTMHFEFRPELLPAGRSTPAAPGPR